MADSGMTPEQLSALNYFAEALNTLATALTTFVSDELLTVAEARAVLVRAGVLTIGTVDDQQT